LIIQRDTATKNTGTHVVCLEQRDDVLATLIKHLTHQETTEDEAADDAYDSNRARRKHFMTFRTFGRLLNRQNADGYTPLHCAVLRDKSDNPEADENNRDSASASASNGIAKCVGFFAAAVAHVFSHQIRIDVY
jgi:hypothetical protein